MKWSVRGDQYVATQDVAPELPPGLYTVHFEDFVGLVFSRVEQHTDRLHALPRTAAGEISGEIETFWQQRDLFDKYGVTFKRGILLCGPAGTGKTSVLNLVTQRAIERGAVVLTDCCHGGLLREALKAFRKVQPDTPLVVLLEDIDRLRKPDLPNMLEVLDGATQTSNVVFLATTNYPEKLPPRLVNRPSRFDRRICVGFPGLRVRQEFLAALSGEPKEEYADWAEKTKGLPFAHIKELFVAVKVLGNDFDKTLASLRNMSEPLSSTDWEEDDPFDDED